MNEPFARPVTLGLTDSDPPFWCAVDQGWVHTHPDGPFITLDPDGTWAWSPTVERGGEP